MAQHAIDLVRINLLLPIVAYSLLAFKLLTIQSRLGGLGPLHTGIEISKQIAFGMFIQTEKP